MNILKWKYCPFCGSQDITHRANYLSCTKCDRGMYENVSATCSIALYTQEGQVVFCERAREPHKGKYDLPGGYVDPDESGVQCIAREIKEELDFDLIIDDIKLQMTAPEVSPLGHDLYTQFLDLNFIYQISQEDFKKMKALDDVASIRLVSFDELKTVELAWEHDKLAMQMLQSQLDGKR